MKKNTFEIAIYLSEYGNEYPSIYMDRPDYVWLSKPVTITFEPLEQSEIFNQQVKALDVELDIALKTIQMLTTKKSELLSLTVQS